MFGEVVPDEEGPAVFAVDAVVSASMLRVGEMSGVNVAGGIEDPSGVQVGIHHVVAVQMIPFRPVAEVGVGQQCRQVVLAPGTLGKRPEERRVGVGGVGEILPVITVFWW